ncbi:MAG: glycosyltransferase [Planctomycetota bacterium]
MSERTTRLLLTLDVERDYDPSWGTPTTLTFRSIHEAIPQLLAPLCAETGMRPTYFVSPEALCDRDAVAVLRGQRDCELAAHLHADYMPGVLPRRQWTDPATEIRWMQKDLSPEHERRLLGELTDLFSQQFGQRPTAFRAGRFGIGRRTGRALYELGYRVDSSITPGVVWTDPAGRSEPDFRHLSHRPYRVHASGDVFATANDLQDGAPLLEVPVTIVPASLCGGAGDSPTWLRPVSSTRAQLLAILEAAARDEDRGLPWQSLCMMFHSMELVAGATPYTATDGDVQRFVDDLRAVAERARELGFGFATMSEFEQAFTRTEDAHKKAPQPNVARVQPQMWTADGPQGTPWQVCYRTPDGDDVDVDAVLATHGVQPWFAYSIRARAERWDNALTYAWLAESLSPEQSVLDIGCGVGANLEWLASRGLRDLSGCDLDPKAIAAGRELLRAAGRETRLWIDDGRTLKAAPDRRYDAICAMNWVQLVDDFDLHAFLRRIRELLSDDGLFAMDYIDRDFDKNPNHRWLSSDVDKPVHQRAPSEYRSRYGAAEIRYELQRCGFEVVRETRNDEPMPKGVLFCRRATRSVAIPTPSQRPEVLYVVDSRGWAHDHKAHNLIRCLQPKFNGRVVYQESLTGEDIDRADVVVIWYWRQLMSFEGLGEALTRNRHKLAMGVCSHNELEGELREAGLDILRRLPHSVFTHSELLEHEVRPLLPDTRPLCLPNGVHAGFFQPRAGARAPGPLRVGWAGSLDNFGPDMRGVSTVIRPAMSLLAQGHPGRFQLLLAAREERLRTPAEMRTFYQGLDVYVCASRVEGTPNPALEAAACGVPIVSTRVGNMPELIEHGQSGILIERDPRALAAALMLIEQRPELRERMGLRLRERIESAWDWQQRARGFARMFDAILADASSSPAQPRPLVQGAV